MSKSQSLTLPLDVTVICPAALKEAPTHSLHWSIVHNGFSNNQFIAFISPQPEDTAVTSHMKSADSSHADANAPRFDSQRTFQKAGGPIAPQLLKRIS